MNIHFIDSSFAVGKYIELMMCQFVFCFVLVHDLESATGAVVEETSDTERLQREKRSILLLKGLAFGKGLLIGKLAGLAVG
jgi:hypothetical protein